VDNARGNMCEHLGHFDKTGCTAGSARGKLCKALVIIVGGRASSPMPMDQLTKRAAQASMLMNKPMVRRASPTDLSSQIYGGEVRQAQFGLIEGLAGQLGDGEVLK
jgi:hypothetical protein